MSAGLKEEKWKVRQLFKDADELRIELSKELEELAWTWEDVQINNRVSRIASLK